MIDWNPFSRNNFARVLSFTVETVKSIEELRIILKSLFFINSLVFFGCIMPIILFPFITSSIIWIYLGSKIFKGTVLLGNIMKFDSGKTAIVLGNSFFSI